MLCYQKDYPRPQFVRKDWINLNGIWEFNFDDANVGEKKKWYKGLTNPLEILVPFTYETKLSGIEDEEVHNYMWYSRKFIVNEEKLYGNKLMLHFEGSDFRTNVWINGKFIGMHEGGYSRFSFDISLHVKDGENTIVVKVEDSLDAQQPRGKQRWAEESYGCWYIQTSGIWKTVWMEYVPNTSLKKVKMTPNLDNKELIIEYILDVIDLDKCEENSLQVEAEITFKGNFVCKTTTSATKNPTKITVNLDIVTKDNIGGVHLWEPGNPNLYDIVFSLKHKDELVDEVGSYFGMRDIKIEGSNILLNGKPLYQKLILDQGYWEDSHLTPPSEEALIEDIDKIARLGYNGLRKHQKIEDERFLYWSDVKGMLVWSEAPAAYIYSDYAVELFAKEWMDIVNQNYNHPSIITWTPINESWGVPNIKTDRKQQHFTEAIYYLTKSIDETRPVIVNDGWEHTVSDIITLHDYESLGDIIRERYLEYKEEILSSQIYHNTFKVAFADGYSYKGQPIIISEYGGIAFNNNDKGWGYGEKVNTNDDFIKRFDNLTTSIKEIPYVCGYCYTQVTDVQQEINGLMDLKRKYKINPDIIKEINNRKVGYWR